MIPIIVGVMVGFYIVTRMLSFLCRSGERSESALVKLFALINFVVAAIPIAVLIRNGFSGL